jgi:hypothetical protein
MLRSGFHPAAVVQARAERRFSDAQLQLRADLALVIPFRANTFMSQHVRHRPEGVWSTAMRCADEAASALLRECMLDAIGTGYNIQISGRIKSLHSISRKMRHKNIPMIQVPRFGLAQPRACTSAAVCPGLQHH